LTRKIFFPVGLAPDPVGNRYDADRLGDDVVAVLDQMKIQDPVLIGHSFAGEKLSSVCSRFPNRIAGLVFSG
jgi:pimeloyl-ACP methyl ester carboxylesterase